MTLKFNARQLVNWCFESSQPHRAENKLQPTTMLFILQVMIPQVFFSNHKFKFYPQFWNPNPDKQNTCVGAYLYSAGTQHGNLHPAG